jgi:hypothetical protein
MSAMLLAGLLCLGSGVGLTGLRLLGLVRMSAASASLLPNLDSVLTALLAWIC